MNIDPLWASAFITIGLVIINIIYVIEMRALRISGLKPIFSLRPDFLIHDEPVKLFLLNSGGVAFDVKIDLVVDNQTLKKLFVSTIPKDCSVEVTGSLDKFQKDKDSIMVKIQYKETFGFFNTKVKSFNLELKELAEEKRRITYYEMPIEEGLLSIRNMLTAIKNDINHGKMQSDNITVYLEEKPQRRNRK